MERIATRCSCCARPKRPMPASALSRRPPDRTADYFLTRLSPKWPLSPRIQPIYGTYSGAWGIHDEPIQIRGRVAAARWARHSRPPAPHFATTQQSTATPAAPQTVCGLRILNRRDTRRIRSTKSGDRAYALVHSQFQATAEPCSRSPRNPGRP
jgi:hypothetical protein